MGTQNHGTQTITHQYFMDAKGSTFGKRQLDIQPTGIYSGGRLTRVNDSQVTLSPFVAEIRDASNQISVRSSASATLNSTTLNGGTISSSTPYLVLRWSYVESASNYVDVYAIDSLANRQQYDLVIGKCEFSGSTLTGFDYSSRTFPRTIDNSFKVEVSPDSDLYVLVRGGRVQSGTSNIVVPEQKVGPFSVPASPDSRIDLVYINTSGTLQIYQGTAAPTPSAPSYGSKLVLAEVKVVNADTSIPWSRITDVRPTIFQIPETKEFGMWLPRDWDTTYEATSDGFIVGWMGGNTSPYVDVHVGPIESDVNNFTSGTLRGRCANWNTYSHPNSNVPFSIMIPVPSGEFWHARVQNNYTTPAVQSGQLFFLPLS